MGVEKIVGESTTTVSEQKIKGKHKREVAMSAAFRTYKKADVCNYNIAFGEILV